MGWQLRRYWLRSAVCIYTSMHTLIDALTEPDDEVVFQTPVHHFLDEILRANSRVSGRKPLVAVDGRYRIDLDTLATQVGRRTRLLLLCNPHDPVGCSWTGPTCRS